MFLLKILLLKILLLKVLLLIVMLLIVMLLRIRVLSLNLYPIDPWPPSFARRFSQRLAVGFIFLPCSNDHDVNLVPSVNDLKMFHNISAVLGDILVDMKEHGLLLLNRSCKLELIILLPAKRTNFHLKSHKEISFNEVPEVKDRPR